MPRPILSKIPIKISVPLLLTAQVIIAVVVLSVIAFGQAQSTVNDLMEQSLAQIHDRIEERLRDLLNHPYRIQRINADLIIEDLLHIEKLRAWQQIILEMNGFRGKERPEDDLTFVIIKEKWAIHRSK